MNKLESVTDKFLRYVKIDTESREETSNPTSPGQHELARLLVSELHEMGAEDVRYDTEFCYVYATIPSTLTEADTAPVLGFISHMDTSPAVTGKGVNPRIVRNYDGRELSLDREGEVKLRPEDFPELLAYVGQDLIVTDGTTLLGADDKAGIAEIMAMAEYFLAHPEKRHGKLRLAFTPDEEVGKGSDHFDVEGFGADFAYTVDAGPIGELEYENFNAASAFLTIHGKSVHPGTAKNTMVNAILLAQEFQSMLPAAENPMYTEGYEGFYHLCAIQGSVEEVRVEYIIRDHDREKFEKKKERFLKIAAYLNDRYGQGTFAVDLQDSYYNMKERLEPHMHLVEHAKRAMEELGIRPLIQPIRGGTDGAKLSFMGLPCPNLCTGGHNFHGKYEFVCVQSMERIVELLERVAESYAEE